MPYHFDRPSVSTWIATADASYRQLRRARATIDDGRRCLEQAQSRLRRRGGMRITESTDPHPDPALKRTPVQIDAWLELGDGSAEQNDEIWQAIQEIVQLQFLLIEGLCRHFPAINQSIREVARHLLEDATNLTNSDCCAGTAVVAPSHMDERAN
jgi:hypothetical protein